MSALTEWWETWKLGAKRVSDAASRTDLVDYPSALYKYATDPKGLADDFAAGGIPADAMAEIVSSFSDAQKALDLTYAEVQRIKKLPVRPDFSSLEKKQQTDFAQYEALLYCFWAVPTFAYELRKAGVRPPQAQYALAAPGEAGDAARKIAAILEKNGASKNLAGLGALPVGAVVAIVAIISALIAVAVIACQSISETQFTEREKLRNESIKLCIESGKCDADMIDALREGDAAVEGEHGKNNPLGDFKSILMWAAVIGAGLIFLPTLISAGRAGKEMIDARRARGFAQPQLPAPALQGRRRRY